MAVVLLEKYMKMKSPLHVLKKGTAPIRRAILRYPVESGGIKTYQ